MVESSAYVSCRPSNNICCSVTTSSSYSEESTIQVCEHHISYFMNKTLKLDPIVMLNLGHVFRLTITCENQSHGCTGVFKLEVLPSHLNECEHNPKKLVPCESGCGFVVPKDEVKVKNFSALIHFMSLIMFRAH